MEDRNDSACCSQSVWVMSMRFFSITELGFMQTLVFANNNLQHYDFQSEEKPQKLTSFIPKIEERINKVRRKWLSKWFLLSVNLTKKKALAISLHFIYRQTFTGTDWLTQEENINIVILRKKWLDFGRTTFTKLANTLSSRKWCLTLSQYSHHYMIQAAVIWYHLTTGTFV